VFPNRRSENFLLFRIWFTEGFIWAVKRCELDGWCLASGFVANLTSEGMGGNGIRLRLKCDGTRADTRFRLSAKWTSPFKSAGGGVSSVDYWQPRCAHQR